MGYMGFGMFKNKHLNKKPDKAFKGFMKSGHASGSQKEISDLEREAQIQEAREKRIQYERVARRNRKIGIILSIALILGVVLAYNTLMDSSEAQREHKRDLIIQMSE